MTARDVYEHLKSVGPWVDWNNSCDQFMHGDPDVEVTGIATAWIGTDSVIRQAAEFGANLIISHEGMFYDQNEEHPTVEKTFAERRALLDELGMTVLRCHDVWDRMPEWGIPDSWAAWLRFEAEPREVTSFYRICLTGGMTVRELAQHVIGRICEFGQESALVVGDLDKVVHRMAVGTGAITRLPEMHDLGADVILATDDGNSWTRDGLWALGMDVPVIFVAHGVAEIPGMMAMAEYLRGQFPDVPVRHFLPEYPRTVLAGQ